MKNLPIVITVLFFASCGTKTENFEPARPAHVASYELGGNSGRDTFNLTDFNGLKQGKWIKKVDTGRDTTICKKEDIIATEITYYKDGVEIKN